MRCRAGWLLVVAIVLPWGLLSTASAEAAPPNLIVFIADDMAVDDCGAYGHPKIRTPNIDALARAGMRFTNAFLTTSSCSPSRCSILTGRYPHASGGHQLHKPLPADQVTFVDRLRRAGYYTASAGKWHLGRAAIARFDTVEQKQNAWVRTLKDRPRDKPFFLWFAFVDPHRPYREGAIPRPHTPADVRVPPFLPDVPETRKDLALYYDEIARLDGVVGRVLAELDRQGQADNTVVVFLSDNGRPFPRCKTTLYDSGIKTPLLVRFPGRVKPGSLCRSVVSTVDLAPTLLDLAGVESPRTFQGRSFKPLLSNPRKSIRRYAYAEHNWHDFDDHGRSVHSARFNYIRNYYTDIPGTPPADAVRSLTFQAMRRLRDQGKLTADQLGCFTKPRLPEELYDVVADPFELNNLARDPRFARDLAEMRDAHVAWQKETGDRVPRQRRADEFDRETGLRLPGFRRGRVKNRVKKKPKS